MSAASEMSAAAASETPPLLQMRGITKRFPGVMALQEVSLSLRAGEVLALMGENGAGKSTLMKILGGVQLPDEGQISISGETVVLGSVKDSKAQGIALIHQELMLAPNLDIASNIFLGNEGVQRRVVRPAPAREAEQACRRADRARRPRPAGDDARLASDCRPDADGGNRQGAVHSSAHHHHG